MDKATVGKIVSAVLTLVVTLLSIFGYHVVVVQPQVAALAAVARAAEASTGPMLEAAEAGESWDQACYRVCVPKAD